MSRNASGNTRSTKVGKARGADAADGDAAKDSPPRSGRRAERIVVNHEFSSIEEFITEYVSNISRTGVFIRSGAPLPVGTQVDLRFTIIDEDFETILGIGEVTRVVPPGGAETPGMGVVFVALSTASQRLVERLLIRRGVR